MSMETSEMSDSSSISVKDDFCSPDKSSVDNSLRYLQQELRMLGLPSLTNEGSRELETSSVLNVIYQLLQLYRHNLKTIDQLKESVQRGKSDVQFQNETQARLKEDVKSYQGEIALLEDRERQLNDKVKAITARLRAEQEEVKRLKQSIQYKQTQQNHENKKREKEYERLKQKLGQLVSDKNQERRLGLSMLNTMQRTDGKRKTWIKPGSSDVQMYQIVVQNFEERQKELTVENTSLRESLFNMQEQLMMLLSDQQTIVPQNFDDPEKCQANKLTNDSSSQAELNTGHFQMPYLIVRDGIERDFTENCKVLSDRIKGLEMKIKDLEGSQVSDADMQGVKSDIEHLQGSSQVSESFIWRERNKLDSERGVFVEQKQDFEEEKQKFVEAVCRLDRERRVFEDKKVLFLQQQLLDVSFLSSTKELDSFYTNMSSTPAQGVAPSPPEDVCKDLELSVNKVDLNHDLSLCSDDGVSVLNDR